MSTTPHRYVGDHKGSIAFIIVAFMAAPLLGVGLYATSAWTRQDVWIFTAIGIAATVPGLIWVGLQLQDIVTVDPDARTLTVLRRRLLLPDAVYLYAGTDVREVELRELPGEDEHLYLARVRLDDGRNFAVTRCQADQAAVEAAARSFLAALGRGDLHPRYPNSMWP
jgi:hypothetical protein